MKEDVFHGVIGQPPSAETVHVVAEDAWLCGRLTLSPIVALTHAYLIMFQRSTTAEYPSWSLPTLRRSPH